jgi:hypothetical protein
MSKKKVELEDALDEEDMVDEVDGHDEDHDDDEDDESSDKKDSDEDEKSGEEDDGANEADKKSKPDASDEGDDKLGATEDDEGDEDEEARKEARRQSRREKKLRAREAREADKRLISSMQQQLQMVNERLAQVDKRGNQQELAQLNQAINAHNDAIQRAERAIQDSFTKKDGRAFTAATQAKDELKDRLSRLNQVKENMVRQSDSRGQPATKINQAVITNAKKFAEDHAWYNVQGKDEDSRIVQAIDETLYEAGFDPATPQYWTELKSRIKRRLPHRFEGKQRSDDAGGSRDGKKKIVGRPGQMGGSAKKTVVQPGGGAVLSKARREAMLADGLQPGTKEWSEQVKAYTKWDKTNASRTK